MFVPTCVYIYFYIQRCDVKNLFLCVPKSLSLTDDAFFFCMWRHQHIIASLNVSSECININIVLKFIYKKHEKKEERLSENFFFTRMALISHVCLHLLKFICSFLFLFSTHSPPSLAPSPS